MTDSQAHGAQLTPQQMKNKRKWTNKVRPCARQAARQEVIAKTAVTPSVCYRNRAGKTVTKIIKERGERDGDRGGREIWQGGDSALHQ